MGTDEQAEDSLSIYSWPCAFNNFSRLLLTVEGCITPALFRIGRYQFRVKVYPYGVTQDNEDYVSVYLELCEPNQAKIRFTQSVLLGTEKHFIKPVEKAWEFDRSTKVLGWSEFVKRDTLFTDVLASTDDQLIILTEFFDLDVSIISNPLHNHEKYVNNQEFSDVQIVIGGQGIFAHKVTLAANEVFAAMFTHELIENEENVINIEDIEFEVMLELIRFIYAGRVCNIEKMPKELLIASDKYGEEELKSHCGKYLCQLLSTKNVVEFLNFAEKYNVEVLHSEAITFFINHKKAIAKSDDFNDTLKEMDTDLLIKIMHALCVS